MSQPNFYCQQKCGYEDFSIDEWNEKFTQGVWMGLSENQMSRHLGEVECKSQCFDCWAIVQVTIARRKHEMKKDETDI